MKRILVTVLTALSSASYAQEEQLVASPNNLFDMSLDELLNLELVDRNFYLYGYINSNIQKTFSYPYRSGDETQRIDDPLEWTPVRNIQPGQLIGTHRLFVQPGTQR